MWFLAASCLLMLLAWIGTRMLVQRGEGPAASSGFMKLLLWIFQFAFACRHSQMSRVFTIQKRTYQVCVACGQEFEYSWVLMHTLRPNVADHAYAPLNTPRHAEGLQFDPGDGPAAI
jgi:hypothetical protein